MMLSRDLCILLKKKSRIEVPSGEPTLCGVIIKTDPNGLSKSIIPLRLGGKLEQTNLI